MDTSAPANMKQSDVMNHTIGALIDTVQTAFTLISVLDARLRTVEMWKAQTIEGEGG